MNNNNNLSIIADRHDAGGMKTLRCFYIQNQSIILVKKMYNLSI